MPKTILSFHILGNNLFSVAMEYAERICNESKCDKNKVYSDLNECTTVESFKEVYEKYFGDEMKIHLPEKK